MRSCTAVVVLLLAFTACSDSGALREQRLAAFQSAAVDSYSWTEQLPSHELGESINRGSVDRDEFMRVLRDYPFGRRVGEANELDRTEPTLTLSHGGLNRYLAISPVGEPNNFGFFLFWGVGSTAVDPRFMPVDGLAQVSGLSALFFDGNIAELDRVFDVEGEPMAAAFGY